MNLPVQACEHARTPPTSVVTVLRMVLCYAAAVKWLWTTPWTLNAQEEVLVPFGATWLWRKGTNEVSSPTSAWREPQFNDSLWAAAKMPFYYGYTATNGTRLADMQNNYTTIYLRKQFVIDNVSDIVSLSLHEFIDDGFVVWINGVEVQRFNVPLGELPYNAGTPGAVDKVQVETNSLVLVTPGLLVPGTNVLAVHGINRSLSSSDFYLDLELRAVRRVLAPPTILSVFPTAGSTLSKLTEIKVVFNKPVVGIEAHELYLNGIPASSVSGGSGTNIYVFRFSQPQPGPVEIRFGSDHCITDLDGNRFDETAPEASWHYTLEDTDAPRIVSILPIPGATLLRLNSIEVVFDEPVAGVDASDLLVNGQPATSVVGSQAGPYTFTIVGSHAGPVTVRWVDDHGIHDFSPAASGFAGGMWSYTVRTGLELADVVINEILTDNLTGLLDEDGQKQDWIELLNRGTVDVNLLGWSLTDTPSEPGKWVFPAVTLKPGQYLVVFASGKDRRSTAAGAKLHTNFRLNQAGGYVGLYSPDLPRHRVSEFAPSYPEQRSDISYGLTPGGELAYFTVPTPGTANALSSAVSGFVQPPHASVKSGFFDEPFQVVLSTSTEGAEIRYTLDGSAPSLESRLYNGPIAVAGTPKKAVVLLRAAAFKSGMLPSQITTHTYIFPRHVVTQPARPEGFPEIWDSPGVDIPGDYEMDPDIVNAGSNADTIRAGLLKLPTLSIVTDVGKLFGPAEGVYVRKDDANQQPVHVELLFPDGRRGFSTPAGLEIQGGTSPSDVGTTWKSKKLSLRLVFKGAYGARSLEYPVFEDSPVKRFNTLVLDNGLNYVWHYNGGSATEDQRVRAQYVRDAFVSDLQRVISGTSVHWRFMHLYLNGLYWGITGVHERPDDKFAEEYFGGDSSEYDVLRHRASNVVAGNNAAYNQMFSIARSGLASNATFEALQQVLDLPWFIDYMIINFWAGNTDWAHQNWYAIRRRTPDGKWRYISWDAEHVLKSPNQNCLSFNDTGGPTELFQLLRTNSEFRVRFADHVHRHFFNGGALSVAAPVKVPLDDPSINRPAALYLERIREIDPAMVGESARWGDSGDYGVDRSNNPLTREKDWIPELLALMGWTNASGHTASFNFFPTRSDIVLGQFVSAGLYPPVAAPTFSQHGGVVPLGFELRITAPTGTIYYTTNGSDPRNYGNGAVSDFAIRYSSPLRLDRSMVIKARALSGATWSALNEAVFTVNAVGLPIVFSEIMYNPKGGDPYEYIEIQNTGPVAIDLSGFGFEGVDCTLPHGTVLAPGAVLVIANGSDPAAFAARYPGVLVTAYFRGNLSNGGERIALIDSGGKTVHAVYYDDEGGWPALADGAGFAIEPVDPNGNLNAAANWQATETLNGNPGQPRRPLIKPAAVWLSEIMASSGSGNTLPDWLELHNPGHEPVDIDGWSLTDDSNPRKYVFPPGTIIQPGDYLVVWCDSSSVLPGHHAGFRLNKHGETILLYDNRTNRVDGITFGLQLPNYSIGRIDGKWQLTKPTPNTPNEPAALASQTNLCLNEWLANAGPGSSDWFELYNRAENAPVALTGLYVETEKGIAQLPDLFFVMPKGYCRFFADEAQGTEHVGLKLPASGGQITLRTSTGDVVDKITYGSQNEGVSEGRLPDGTSNIIAFPESPSPGAANYVPTWSGPCLNEILVRNTRAVVSPWGDYSACVELFNPSSTPIDFGGFSLVTSAGDRWVFPAGTLVESTAYLVVWCNGGKRASTTRSSVLNSGFALDPNSCAVALLDNSGRVVDRITYGFQVRDMSIGRSGGTWQLLAWPTIGSTNAPPAQLGSPTSLRINEWAACPNHGADWFELYNMSELPVELNGLFVTDDPSITGRTKSPIGPLSYIGARDFVCFIADENTSAGLNHVAFALDSSGETIRLYTADLKLIDSIDFGHQQTGVSQGRLPDGSEQIVAFSDTPTPGASNYIPLRHVVINEVLSNPSPPFEDAIELYNITDSPVDISGWYLSDTTTDPKRYKIPNGTIIPPRSYCVFYQFQFGPGAGEDDAPPYFSLNSVHGDCLFLWEVDVNGNLTGRRTGETFGPVATGMSFGRYRTSIGFDFVPLSQSTFGADNAVTVEQFRTGMGLDNASPAIGPIIINEIMYRPSASAPPAILDNLEFVELHNITSTNVPLYDVLHPTNSWKLAGGISFDFPPNTIIPGGGYLIIVPFDPIHESAAFAAFKEFYGNVPAPLVGPYTGKLNNAGDTLELLRPLGPVEPPRPDAGFVPYMLVDRVNYDDEWPWPTAADGESASLQRVSPNTYGNDPASWKTAGPTPGMPNVGLTNSPPIIVDQPFSPTVIVGQRVILTVLVQGSQPIEFQWYHGADPIPGATNQTLVISKTAMDHAGEYRVLITNPLGRVLSEPAVLKILDPPFLSTPEITENGQFTVKLFAPTNNIYALERSTNLVTWTHVGSVEVITTPVTLTDTFLQGASGTYYRVRLVE